MTNITDPFSLPHRIATRTVLALAGYKLNTLRRRQADGLMPEPIDRGGEGDIYLRDAILKALGIAAEPPPELENPWKFNAEAYRALEERDRRLRGKGGRPKSTE